ncbi:MAG: DNA photolyase family protein [Thermodesulfovibrio sp.]|nr:DNA photolyase family protein [Thermodesulfovibrio sp.]
MYRRVFYWFKRDLRIDDNKAFYEACKNSFELIPLFIFIPSILKKFRSYDRRTGFIISCLKHLSKEIEKKGGKLYCFHEEPVKVFYNLIKKYKPQAIYTNRAFSYSGEEVENQVKRLCFDMGVDFISFSDIFLSKIENIPYKRVFSSFYRSWKMNLLLESLPIPHRINTPALQEPDINEISSNIKHEENSIWSISYGFQRLKSFDFIRYETLRNRVDLDGTSKFSPYIRFGLISLRKIYNLASNTAGQDCQFIKELAWREFWYHIKINFPEFKDLEFQEKRRNIHWENNEKFYKALIEAKTGYPIVDAAVVQLKEEGWMHNRARMIVASFLTKDLLIDWRWGEKFFMEYLIDYDEIVNIGNWQWTASVGPDAKPFRIFNPLIQAKKFDPYCGFIKKYLPQLKSIPIYKLQNPLSYRLPYYKPIVNHFERVLLARKIYLKTYST